MTQINLGLDQKSSLCSQVSAQDQVASPGSLHYHDRSPGRAQPLKPSLTWSESVRKCQADQFCQKEYDILTKQQQFLCHTTIIMRKLA
ncbi:hypothetical protein PoB_005012100 [Plakobranchus ocellatus]|uniref:Uncharacterized protein n=1 Tax=Plakobranchus ocellatus TaxID=259542 RepID=A0AAV4BT18_9GAST|nr:hypothetical protein PoB_005012100 [Plakobranchus ocellatus]